MDTYSPNRNFQRNRPNDSIREADICEDKSDDELEDNIELQEPTLWNKFASIGNVEDALHTIFEKNKISQITDIMSLKDCIQKLVKRKISEQYLNNNFEEIVENMNRKVIFVSVISRFTTRVYGEGREIYFIHIRFNFYLLAEANNEGDEGHFSNNYKEYSSTLGSKHTHIPITDEKGESSKNEETLISLMKLLKNKQQFDKFQPSYKNQGGLFIFSKSSFDDEDPKYDAYKCVLHVEELHYGFAEILEGENKGEKIHLYNRKNCNRAFTKDIVNVKIFENKFSGKKSTNKYPQTGKVTSVIHSDVKPVNKLFLCKLMYGKVTLMIPICRTLPVIYIGEKHLLIKQNAISHDNNLYVTIKKLNQDMTTTIKEKYKIDPYNCDMIFLVLYRKWDKNCIFPFGEVVGRYSPDIEFKNIFPLIKLLCGIPAISIDEESIITDKISRIKKAKLKELKKEDPKIDNRGAHTKSEEKTKIYFCISNSMIEFNEIAYSYEKLASTEIIGIHVVDVNKYIDENDSLDINARIKYFTYLLPNIRKDEILDIEPEYLFPAALTTRYLSIQKNKEIDVISFYLEINEQNSVIGKSNNHFILEKITINMEIDSNGTDEIIRNNKSDYSFFIRMFEFCQSQRNERMKHVIPTHCFYPNFRLKHNLTTTIMEEELKYLINKSAFMLYKSEEHVDTSEMENMNDYDANLSPMLHIRMQQFFPQNPYSIHRNRFSKQFFEQIFKDRSINLFRCEALFPDTGAYHQKWLSTIGSDISDPYLIFHETDRTLTEVDIMNPFKVHRGDERTLNKGHERVKRKLFCSKLLQMTSPLTCYLDVALQRILKLRIKGIDTDQSEINDLYDEFKRFQVSLGKYWNTCSVYEIRHLFNEESFILDCVYEKRSDDRIFFNHPFLNEVNYDNFIYLDSLNLNKMPSNTTESDNWVHLIWKTRIFSHINDCEEQRPHDNKFSLNDIYSVTSDRFSNCNEYPDLMDKYFDPSDENSDLTDENSDLTDEHSDLTDEHSDLTDENSDLTDENSDLSDKHSDLTDKDSDLTDEHSDLSDKHSDLTDEDFDHNDTHIHHIKDELKSKESLNRCTSEISTNIDPTITIDYEMKPQQIMRIQFGYDYNNGIMKIVPELWIINPDFRLCLNHRNDPLKYFMHPKELSRLNSKRFHNLREYKLQFIILSRLEGIHQAQNSESSFIIQNIKVDWIAIKIQTDETEIFQQEDNYGDFLLEGSWCLERFLRFVHKNTRMLDPFQALEEAVHKNKMDYLLCIQTFIEERNVYWIGHCRLADISVIKKEKTTDCRKKDWRKDVLVHLTMKLVHSSFPLKHSDKQLYTIEFLEIPISTRIFERSLKMLKEESIAAKIVMNQMLGCQINNDLPSLDTTEYLDEISVNMTDKCTLNDKQNKALVNAIKSKFTLIWGPPGTGKTLVGGLIAYYYTMINKRRDKKSVVLYCGPSNESVNVVSEKLIKTFGEKCPKLLRVFNSEIMNFDFPCPGKKYKTVSSGCPNSLKSIALHHIVREERNPYSTELKEFLDSLSLNEKQKSTRKLEYALSINEYENYLKKAFQWEIENGDYEIILTTAATACKKLLESKELIFSQVILDEAAMCSEPESLGPILNKNELENVVFIGDHKQLRPIITSQVAKFKQLGKSLFERLYENGIYNKIMLDTQYRMHPSICEFPSINFYENERAGIDSKGKTCLKTACCQNWTGIPEYKVGSDFNGLQYDSLYKGYKKDLKKKNVRIADNFWKKGGKRRKNFRCYPKDINFKGKTVYEKIMFINCLGVELTQEISCSTGGKLSKCNESEVEIVEYLYRSLISKINPSNNTAETILVITQYRLQEHILIKKCQNILDELKITGLPRVSTVIKSQGSESDYVIFSTVRSLPTLYDIDTDATSGWVSKYLGFITDKNQFNVAITRAKKGLFIIGNSHLLSVNKMWEGFLRNLKERGCFIDDISKLKENE